MTIKPRTSTVLCSTTQYYSDLQCLHCVPCFAWLPDCYVINIHIINTHTYMKQNRKRTPANPEPKREGNTIQTAF